MKKNIRISFTLIEMLIVIVIIGILAAALIPRLVSVQGRARDARREVDMNQIYNGLMIYYNDRGSLPMPAAYGESNYGGRDSSTSGRFLTFLISGGIMNSVPLDPININPGNPTAGSYAYHYYCYTSNPIGMTLIYVKEKDGALYYKTSNSSNRDAVMTSCVNYIP